MTDETIPDHTLRLLQEIRAAQDEHQNETRERFDRVDEHLVRIEVRLTGIEQTSGAMLSMYGAQNERLDKLEADVARINRRLELVD